MVVPSHVLQSFVEHSVFLQWYDPGMHDVTTDDHVTSESYISCDSDSSDHSVLKHHGINSGCQNDGSVVLHRYDKNQQIFIPRDSWLKLVDLKDIIDQSLAAKLAERWPLGNQLYAVATAYNNGFFYTFVYGGKNSLQNKVCP